MALRPRESPFFGLRGVKEDEPVVLLSDVFSPGGSKNVFHDDRQRLTRLPGLDKLTASQILSSTACRSLFEFIYESSGATVRELLAVFGASIYKIDVSAGTGSSIGTDLATTDDFPGIDSIYDKAYVASGATKELKSYDGTTFANAGGSQPTAPTLADGGGAGGHKGTIYVKYRYVKSDNSLGIASAASSPLLVEGRKITVTVTNGPGGTQGKMIYLTTGDNDVFFYYAGVIDDNSTTTLTLDVKDVDLIKAEELDADGDPPPTGTRVVVATQGVLWIGNKDGDRGSAWRSDRGLPESFHVLKKIRFATERGDEIMAMLPGIDRAGETTRTTELMVFTRKAVYNLFGRSFHFDDTDLYAISKTKAPTGTLAGRSVVLLPYQGDDVAAYIGSDRQIYINNGTTAVPVSGPVQDTLSAINMAKAHLSFGVRIPPPIDGVVWFFPKGSATLPDTGILWQASEDAWHIIEDHPKMMSGVLFQDSNLAFHVFFGEGDSAVGGYIYEGLKSGENQIDGVNMTGRWRSKPLLGDEGFTKLFEYLEVICKEEAGVTLTIKVWEGFKDPDTETPFLETTMDLEDSTLTDVKKILEIENSSGAMIVDEEITVEFSTNSNVAQFRLVGFRFGYKIKPRKRRGA